MADSSGGAAGRPEEDPEELTQVKKRKRAGKEPEQEKKAFRLSDWVFKTINLSYKQLRLDEEQRWGQVCWCLTFRLPDFAFCF